MCINITYTSIYAMIIDRLYNIYSLRFVISNGPSSRRRINRMGRYIFIIVSRDLSPSDRLIYEYIRRDQDYHYIIIYT